MKSLIFLIMVAIPLVAQQTDCEFLTKNFEKRLHIFVNEHSALPNMKDHFDKELKLIDLHFPGVKSSEDNKLRGKLYTNYLYGESYFSAYWGYATGNGDTIDFSQLFSEEELAKFARQQKSGSILTIASGVTMGVGLGLLIVAGIEAGTSWGSSDVSSTLTAAAIMGGVGLVGFTVAIPLGHSQRRKTKQRMLEHNSRVMRDYLKVQCQ